MVIDKTGMIYWKYLYLKREAEIVDEELQKKTNFMEQLYLSTLKLGIEQKLNFFKQVIFN